MRKNLKALPILLSTTMLGVSVPALAQSGATDASDIIVTARRVEERMQDVPISMTVFTPQQIANNNIQSAKDIATYTPSLTTNNRNGSDNTTFAIRGFTQEPRSTPTVGTYFADVVALRGSGSNVGGDGAGPGLLFDLQNVQVLKGPQGTLQGRNSTGGAVLLVPVKPTGRFEGFIEGSLGDYSLKRLQGAINIPVMDSLRVRMSFDRNTRDGYIKNVGLIGAGPYGQDMGSVDYTALRLSVVADLAPNLENYTIISYSKSKSTGNGPKILKCFSATYCNQMAREAPFGFWSGSNSIPDAQSVIESWQAINTTTWTPSDSLVIKNIASYGELRGTTNIDLFGVYRPVVTPGTETNGSQVAPLSYVHALNDTGHNNAESSFVEELQFQGHPGTGRFIWQAGLYLELNEPLGKSGVTSATVTPCLDLNSFNCLPSDGGVTSLGRINQQVIKTSFRDMAAYAQASYSITDKIKLTAGIRYTSDLMRSNFQIQDIRLNTGGLGNFVTCTNTLTFGAQGSATNPRLPIDQRNNICGEFHRVTSSAPTWLIDLDYKPIEDILLYAKWSRGYRQGGVAPLAPDKLQDYKNETVDAYEVGAKTSWRGAMPGYFNVAGFYNNFRNQQVQLGLGCFPATACAQVSAILNVGKSRLYGVEVEGGLTPFKGLHLTAAYAYLKTEIQQVTDAVPILAGLGLPYNDVRPPRVGDPILNTLPHKLTASATYTLPLPDSVGEISVGGTLVYQSSYRGAADATLGTGYGILPAATYGNVNVNWTNIAGHPVDAGFFMTNVTNSKIYLQVNDQSLTGFVSYLLGEPRMYGFRLKYHF